jgi:hypothetical protein
MMIKSGFVPDTLEDYDEFDDLVWADRDTESVWMKHDVIYGDLEDVWSLTISTRPILT